MESVFHTTVGILRVIGVIGSVNSGPEVEKCALSNASEALPSWCYLHVHHSKDILFVDLFGCDFFFFFFINVSDNILHKTCFTNIYIP